MMNRLNKVKDKKEENQGLLDFYYYKKIMPTVKHKKGRGFRRRLWGLGGCVLLKAYLRGYPKGGITGY